LTQPGLTYEYAPTTSNTVLRNHLNRAYKEEFIRVSKEKGWRMSSQSKAGSEATGSSLAVFHTKFTQKAFLEHLINFIVTDDQVCVA
jgi:hypothetical protein